MTQSAETGSAKTLPAVGLAATRAPAARTAIGHQARAKRRICMDLTSPVAFDSNLREAQQIGFPSFLYWQVADACWSRTERRRPNRTGSRRGGLGGADSLQMARPTCGPSVSRPGPR